MKKLWSILLAMMLLFAAVGAYAEVSLEDDESVHYSFTIMQGKQFDVPASNPTLSFLEDKFNADFEFMLVSRGNNDYQNKWQHADRVQRYSGPDPDQRLFHSDQHG